jgi:glycosyltransferase involved in cell wall biosynthesis
MVGEGPEQIPSFRRRPPGVKFLGFVDRLDSIYASTRVVCSPIRSGGGTRVKLVEAASYGRPIISSSIGAEGLPLMNEVSILIRDSPEDFAESCLQLLQDDGLARRLGTAARDVAKAHFDRRAIVAKIEQECLVGS